MEYSVSGHELCNHSRMLRKKELPSGRPVICYTATHLSSRRLNLPMLARQIVFGIAQGNMSGIDNMHERVKTLIDRSLRRDAKGVVLTRENSFELRAFLQILSAAQRYLRQLDRTSIDPFRTGAKSDAAARLGAPRITEQVLIWTIQYRRVPDRNGLHYPSDFTDAEWQLLKGVVP